MSHPIHPLEATQRVRDDYMRYLRTIYFFRDEELRQQFWQALAAADFLVRGPILEAAPPFRAGRSIGQMVDAGLLHSDFRRLCSPALPLDRLLYLHQDRAIERVVGRDRNVVVATGTGSGKTEAFLIPIFEHLLRQRAAGTLAQPGVRALLLYPMNALANDQLKRLRRLLANFPEITFGRYTGETEEQQSKAESLFREQFPDDEPLPNELISRQAMWASPPHILITNYAMLEYLLLRPKDSEFFDGEAGQFWRFIALDEAHIYDGASGIEIAMLLRRLKDRVVRSEPGRLRCIATSATLGRGREDFPAVARFASEIFGETFQWIDGDPRRQDVVEGVREEMAELSKPWGEGRDALYAALTEALADEATTPKTLADLARTHAVPESVVDTAEQAARRTEKDPLPKAAGHSVAINRFLFDVLRGDDHLHTLRSALKEPRSLAALAADPAAAESVVNLVQLAVRARPGPDSMSLLPARYHVFARALEGAFVCLNANHPAHVEQGKPRFFLTRHEQCPHCRSWVFEVATCPRCGTVYIVGREADEYAAGGRALHVLRQASASNDATMDSLSYFILAEQVQKPDEDEAVMIGESVDRLENERLEPYEVCLGCGAVDTVAGGGRQCNCTGTPSKIMQRVYLDEPSGESTARRSARGGLNYCVSCGARSQSGIVYRFLTGQDAPVSVLATSLYQLLPPDTQGDAAELPGQGRKLLVFADSRQDAAFFAPYLERTYAQILRRRLILKALADDEDGRRGSLRLTDVATRVRDQAEDATLFTSDQSLDERNRTAREWLAQEFVALDSRIGLEGLGLLNFRLVPPKQWQPPAPLLEAPWNLTPAEARDLLLILLNTLRQQGAVTFPPHVDPKSEAFAPRNVELFVQEFADGKRSILGWSPKRGGNRRVDYLTRLLRSRTKLPQDQADRAARETLTGIWKYLTATKSPWRDHLASEMKGAAGVVYRLDYRFWEWVPAAEAGLPVYRCNRCFSVSYVNLDNVCPAYGCDGTLERVDTHASAWDANHYRHLYQTLEPISISAEEHTAQWTPKEAGRVQDRFIRGQINVLSCSTTFELGVDVGDLQAVLMRNVPPTTANYIQRAGRAGRRTDSVAFVLTYAQRRSHDLTHFKQPEKMVSGRIQAPQIEVRNEKIVRRHMHSVFLAAFFRWAKDTHDQLFPNVGMFFAPNNGKPSGPALLGDYVSRRPDALQAVLRRIVPQDLHFALGIDDWSWLPALTTDDHNGILDLAVREVEEDLALYARLEQEAAAEKHYRVAEHYQRVIVTVRTRDLLGFLGNRNVLPAYGFPTNVVELRTSHIPIPQARLVELQRDLRIAIAEYAPGGEVVAAKHIWTGAGIYRIPGREWPVINYAVCPGCGRFYGSKEQALEGVCSVCFSNLHGRSRLYGKFIVPEFGFLAGRDVRETGERRPLKLHASRVFFSDYAPGDNDEPAAYEPVPELSGPAIRLTRRYSRYGKLALVNAGLRGAGFRICTVCGWAEPAPFAGTGKPGKPKTSHENPRTGHACSGRYETYHLGHEFITDVLELRFAGALAPSGVYRLWNSVLYALLEGASETLSIPRDDLDGTIYPYQGGEPPALVLFDNVPGGAGHVRRVAEALPVIVRAAWDRVARCECGEETSCYECLRNFYNQWSHDQLQRGPARDFLAHVVQQNAVESA